MHIGIDNRREIPPGSTRVRSLRRGGFTLIEVLLVVVIVAIIATVTIVQLQYNTRHAELTTLRYNEATLNQMISVVTVHAPGNSVGGCRWAWAA